jgi:hypothetical protein
MYLWRMPGVSSSAPVSTIQGHHVAYSTAGGISLPEILFFEFARSARPTPAIGR